MQEQIVVDAVVQFRITLQIKRGNICKESRWGLAVAEQYRYTIGESGIHTSCEDCLNPQQHNLRKTNLRKERQYMSDGAKLLFDSIRSNDTGPPEYNLRTEYAAMSVTSRNNLKIQTAFVKVLNEILAPFAESKGELVVSLNSANCYFALEGIPITNFGVVLLSTIQVHYTDHIRHDLELLIWGKLLPPRVIRIEAKSLRSSGWVDGLGPKYFCETRGIKSIKALIQAMAQYAPVKDEYMYSGWDAESGNAYIMGGQPLCSDDWSAVEAKDTCLHALKLLDVAPHALTIPLLAVALLSLVHSQMVDGGTFFKGVCCIVAPTQSFKTTLASLFFDFANGREADINFEATMAACEPSETPGILRLL